MELSEIEMQILKHLSISLGWEDIADPRNEYNSEHITPDEYLHSCRKLKLLGYIDLEEHTKHLNFVYAKINSQGLNFLHSHSYTSIAVENPNPKPEKKIPKWMQLMMWSIGTVIALLSLLKTLGFI